MTRRKIPIGIQTFAKLRDGELVRQARARHGQRAVVLVDEYDKPILDNITDGAIARQMRDGLRDLYSVIKGRPMPTSTARAASRST